MKPINKRNRYFRFMGGRVLENIFDEIENVTRNNGDNSILCGKSLWRVLARPIHREIFFKISGWEEK